MGSGSTFTRSFSLPAPRTMRSLRQRATPALGTQTTTVVVTVVMARMTTRSFPLLTSVRASMFVATFAFAMLAFPPVMLSLMTTRSMLTS